MRGYSTGARPTGHILKCVNVAVQRFLQIPVRLLYFINFIIRTSRCRPSHCRRRHSLAVSVQMRDPTRNHSLLQLNFYRAMHFSTNARSWDRMSSVCPSVRLSVRLSVTLVICDHICWKSWKLIARIISPTPSLFAAKRRSAYSQAGPDLAGGGPGAQP